MDRGLRVPVTVQLNDQLPSSPSQLASGQQREDSSRGILLGDFPITLASGKWPSMTPPMGCSWHLISFTVYVLLMLHPGSFCPLLSIHSNQTWQAQAVSRNPTNGLPPQFPDLELRDCSRFYSSLNPLFQSLLLWLLTQTLPLVQFPGIHDWFGMIFFLALI